MKLTTIKSREATANKFNFHYAEHRNEYTKTVGMQRFKVKYLVGDWYVCLSVDGQFKALSGGFEFPATAMKWQFAMCGNNPAAHKHLEYLI